MRDGLLDRVGAGRLDGEALRAAAEAAGFAAILEKLDGLAAHSSHWYMKIGAAEADAEEVLRQALTLHHRARALHRELHLAEVALGIESSEANLGRLKDIQDQLLALGGQRPPLMVSAHRRGRSGGTL